MYWLNLQSLIVLTLASYLIWTVVGGWRNCSFWKYVFCREGLGQNQTKAKISYSFRVEVAR